MTTEAVEFALTESAEDVRTRANAVALERLLTAEPVLVDVAPARDVVPGMTESTILTSGAPLEWPQYTGGQRRSILNAALYEGLADSVEAAEKALDSGRITVHSTQQHQCIGSVAGIYTASMPVLVVRDETYGGTAFCNLYEGKSRHRLNYGSYNDEVRDGLQWLQNVIAPVLATAIELHGPIPLKPIMTRALRLGDELHSRNTAASMIFERELTTSFIKMGNTPSAAAVADVLEFFRDNDYTFLRMGMAAAKAIADAAHGVAASTLVTGMAINCLSFGIRISGLGTGGSPAPTRNSTEVLRRLRPRRRRMDRRRELLHRGGGVAHSPRRQPCTAGLPGWRLHHDDGQQHLAVLHHAGRASSIRHPRTGFPWHPGGDRPGGGDQATTHTDDRRRPRGQLRRPDRRRPAHPRFGLFPLRVRQLSRTI
jgi:hypothetical protein